jgi:tetratricopeptide (TPR) repeat protein
VLLVFGQTVGFDFLQWDDDINVTENPHLVPGAGGPARFWTAPYAGLYVPVAYTVFWAEARLSALGRGADPDPRVFHAGNLLLHLGCCLLAFMLLRRVLGSGPAAMAGALLFAMHPLQAETVSWVTETKGLLAALGTLAAVAAYLRFADGGGWGVWAAATGAFGLALLAKPSAVVTPLLAAVLVVAVGRGRSPRRTLLPLVPWVVLAAALVVVTKSQQPETVLRVETPVPARPFVALDALAFYLAKLVAPVGLCPDYVRTPPRVVAAGAQWIWVLPFLAAAAAFRWRRTVGTAAAWWLAALLPVLGLVPFEYQNISTVADRYQYVAMLGPALALGALVAARPRWWPAVAVVLVAAGAAGARQASFWHDTERLFARTLRLHPDSFSAHNNLGVYLAKRGRYDEAIEHYTAAIRADPEFIRPWINRGQCLHKLGRDEEAAADYREAIRLVPAAPDAHLLLADVLDALGRPDEAAQHRTLAMRASPDSPEQHNSLGVTYYERGDLERAAFHLREALRIRPRYAEAHNNLAACLIRAGNVSEGVQHYREAIRIEPDYLNAHVNLGKVLMRRGDIDEAIFHFERALEIGGEDPEIRAALERLRAERAGAGR